MKDYKIIVWILTVFIVFSVIGLSLISILLDKPCDEIDYTLLSGLLTTITILSVLSLSLIMYKSFRIDQENSRHRNQMQELLLRHLTDKADLKKELGNEDVITLKTLLANFNKFMGE